MICQRAGHSAAGYVGAFCLLALIIVYGAPPLLNAAAGPDYRSPTAFPGWSLGQPLIPRGTRVLDRVRDHRTGAGVTAAASDPSNTALHFDGLDDRVTFGPAPLLGASTFTIETWFRQDGPGATASTGSGGVVAVPLVTKGMAETDAGDTKDTNYFLGIDGKRRVLAADFEDTINGGNHPAFGVTPIYDGIWYHAAATYDGTTWRLYLNGTLETQVVVGAFTPRFDSVQHAALGTALNSTGMASGAFLGALDEVRIWNVARTAADIQLQMTVPVASAAGLIGRWRLDEGLGTAVVDSTGNGNTGTLLNGPGWIAGTPFVSTPLPVNNYGLHLKGTTTAADYVSFAAASALGTPAFTVETWFQRDGAGVTTTTGTGGLAAVVPLVAKGRNDGTDGGLLDINYLLGLSGNVLAADFEEGAAGTSPGLNHPITGVTPIQNSVWNHGAVTYDGTTLQLYLNGVLEATAVVGQPARGDGIEPAALGTALTATGVAAGFFAGTIDEARIWSYARTPAQIASGRDREIAGASGLLGRWSFNDCCGQPQDSSGHNQTGTLFGRSWTLVTGGQFTTTVNAAPSVNAGVDQTVRLPATALLSGSLTEDGLSGAPITTTWGKTSGPGTVTFGNGLALTSTATFPVSGTYVLTLTANDGELSGSDAVTIQVNPAVAVNLPPAANAGPDQTITLPSQASLSGTVSDDGLPGGDPIATWSKASGPGTVSFAQPNEWATTATFSSAGTYVLMLTANDGALTGGDTLTVTVSAASSANKGLAFGGTNAYVTFGLAPGLGAATFTIETWFRRDGTGVATSTGSGGVTAVPLVTKGRSESDGSPVDMNYFLGISNASNVLTADFEEGAGGPTPGLNHPISGVTPIQNNIWYHAAATYDGTKWQLFLNGTLERELTVGRPPRSDSIQHAAIASALNSTGAASGFFNGAIDEVRIWSSARTTQQITDGMSGEIASAPGLLGRWALNEGSGTLVNDSSGHVITGTLVGTSRSWGQGAPFNIEANTPPEAPVLNAPAHAGGSGSPATLDVSVSDPDSDTMTATFYGRQKAVVAPDFTLATLPDTQHYVDNATTFSATFTAQTNWIVNNQAALNIAFVSHLGDVTQNIDQFEIEWQRANTSMNVLDASTIPHGMSPGNHDETSAGVANFYDQYFPVARFQAYPWYGGYLGQEADDPVNRQNKNNYELFSVGGLDFLVIHIEIDWPDYSVAWADKIIKRYPNRRVVLSTHAFLNTSNARPTSTQFARSNGRSAEAVWQAIVRPNCNVFMVINGHYPGEGRRTDLNACGQPVHQVLMDYQDRINGGDGWLRYFTFKPSENKIYAYTYSPTRNGGAGDFETDDSSQFVLDYDMLGASFSVIATNPEVSSGARTTALWPGLTPGVDYEWYVAVNDGTVTTTGSVWTFRAGAKGNTAPVASGDTYAVGEDSALTVPAPGPLSNDSDAEANSLSAVLVSSPSHGALVLNANGGFTYVPGANFNGSDSFTYKANDGTADSNVATVTLAVTAVNDSPSASDQTVVTVEDTAKAIALSATDVEGSALTYAIVTGPAHGSLTGTAPTLTYTPAANYNGVDSFTFRANDGSLASNAATVSITVTSVNDAPKAIDQAVVTDEDTAKAITLSATDAEGLPLTYVIGTGPTHGTLSGAVPTVIYSPAASYNGPDSFSFKANDGALDSNLATVSITVTAVNDAPMAIDQAVVTDEDAAKAITLSATDAEGLPLTYVIGTGPTHGTLSGSAPAVTYTPAASYNGPDSFSFKANDGALDSNVATVSITITPVNNPPAAANDSYSTAKDVVLTVGTPGVLGNDTDVDSPTLTAVVVSGPTHGTLTLSGSGGFTYTPAANYRGADSFIYKANDGSLGSNVATVTIAVTSVNDAPVAVNDSYSANEDTTLTVTAPGVLSNDGDANGDALTAILVGPPSHGTLTLGANGTVTYTPAADYNGPDNFTYKANNSTGDSNLATVSITVIAVNDAPVAVNDSYSTNENTALTIAAPGLLANDLDMDSPARTAIKVSNPAHGTVTVSANGRIVYTPTAMYSGPDSFTYKANDGLLDSTIATVTIAVNCPCTIWPTSATPAQIANDRSAVELGVRFRSDVSGSITSLRFYKGAGNTGTHVAHLWTNGGVLLATATFTGETASGWQTVNFPTPVPITANTTYVASYHTNVGQYAATTPFFASAGVDSAPLHALRSGVDGSNGAYLYGASGFPNQTFDTANYWVDVIFR